MKEFYLRGYIYVTDVNKIEQNIGDNEGVVFSILNINFEVIEEDFFHFGFSQDGYSLGQSEIDVTLKYNLKDFIDDLDVEEGFYYSVLWNFDFDCYQDYFGDCDCDINTEILKIEKVTQENIIKYLENNNEVIEKNDDDEKQKSQI
jgi:hypothetical protein